MKKLNRRQFIKTLPAAAGIIVAPGLVKSAYGRWYYGSAGATGGGGGCISGTYMSAWDGNYPSDTDKLCVNSGASNKDGTQSGGTLVAGSFTVTDRDQYLSWPISALDIFDEDAGTVYLEINSDSGNSGVAYLFEAVAATPNEPGNRMALYVDHSASDIIVAIRYGNGATDNVSDPSATVTKGSTQTIGMTWEVGRAVADLAITANKGTNWYDDGAAEGIGTMASTPATICIGENYFGGTAGQTTTITKMAVVAGWKGACPW